MCIHCDHVAALDGLVFEYLRGELLGTLPKLAGLALIPCTDGQRCVGSLRSNKHDGVFAISSWLAFTDAPGKLLDLALDVLLVV